MGRVASTAEIRGAYRDLARRLHPDRVASGSASGGSGDGEMAAVNEAYRVLSDPGRRMIYDRSLVAGATTGSAVGGGATSRAADDREYEPPPPRRHTVLAPDGPARVPWKLMSIVALIGSGAVLLSSFFADPPAVRPPDGVVELGSCVAFEPNGDVREVACTGTADDVVVERIVPLDGACPPASSSHRDRLGMGRVCIPNG